MSVTPQPRKISKLVDRLLNWFAHHARDLPWRRTHDPYGVYVSEIMLQQTQVKTVIPYWERWMQELPTVAAAAGAAPARIHKLWEGLGYYTRVRNLQRAAQTIVREQPMAASFQHSLNWSWICQGLDVTRRARSAVLRSINRHQFSTAMWSAC